MDLTKITTPFGLLDAETQKALKEHGGPYQMYATRNGWMDWTPNWDAAMTYRVKPKLPKPREWYLNIHGDKRGYCYLTRHEADANALSSRIECVHVREVL